MKITYYVLHITIKTNIMTNYRRIKWTKCTVVYKLTLISMYFSRVLYFISEDVYPHSGKNMSYIYTRRYHRRFSFYIRLLFVWNYWQFIRFVFTLVLVIRWWDGTIRLQPLPTKQKKNNKKLTNKQTNNNVQPLLAQFNAVIVQYWNSC